MLSTLINVAIVDDHTLFRKALKNYLTQQQNINVVIQSPDIPDLLPKLKDQKVHILLMDIFMPKLNGYDGVKIIKEQYPELKILVLSMSTDMALLSDMLDMGVYGLLSKSDEPENLLHAILSLSEQRIYQSRLFTEVMYWTKQHYIGNNKMEILLTEREKEILQLLWEEKSNKEIAEHLFLSVRSVEKIRQDMKEKVGVKSTVGLLKYAINNKVIRIVHENSALRSA